MKKIITIIIALLMAASAIIPCIQSQHLQVSKGSLCSTKTNKQNNNFARIKVFYHKGIQGVEQKEITIITTKLQTLQNQLEEIRAKELPLKAKIKQQLSLLHKYNIIPSRISYGNIAKIFSRQKPLLKKIGLHCVHRFKTQSSKAGIKGMNALALTMLWGDTKGSTLFGIPPSALYPPFLSLPSLWLAAHLPSESGGAGFQSVGLLGIQTAHIDRYVAGSVFLAGFVGIALITYAPLGGEGYLGIGLCAFIVAAS